MKKKWMASLPFLGVVFVLIGFVKADEKPQIVVVLQELNTDHSNFVKAGVEKGFADFDIDGKVIASSSTTQQVTMLEDALKQNPDALIVTPTQSDTVIPVLKEYRTKSIPVLMLNEDAEWKDQTTFVGTDHLRLGKIAGELLSSTLQPGGQVAFIFDTQANSVEKDWIKGAKESVENCGIKVITVQQEHNESGNVKSVMSSILQTYPDIKGLFVTDENTVSDVLKIIEEKALKISVVGTHGSMGMLKAVEEEKLSAIAVQNPYDMGYLSVEQALKAIKGEHVEKRIDSGVDIITKDNARWIIDFYEKEVFKY